PFLTFSVPHGGGATSITREIAPWCRVAYKELLYQVGLARGGSLIPEKTYIREFQGCIVYVSKVRGTNLEDVLIYRLKDNKVEGYTRADTGTIGFNPSNRVISVMLENANDVSFREGHRE